MIIPCLLTHQRISDILNSLQAALHFVILSFCQSLAPTRLSLAHSWRGSQHADRRVFEHRPDHLEAGAAQSSIHLEDGAPSSKAIPIAACDRHLTNAPRLQGPGLQVRLSVRVAALASVATLASVAALASVATLASVAAPITAR